VTPSPHDAYRETVVRWVDPADAGRFASGATLDGLGYLRAIAAGTLPDAPAIATLGARLVEIDAGCARVSWMPTALHCNAMRVVHGGVLSTLLDTAMGYAVVSTLAVGQGFSTLQMTVSFLRSVGPDGGEVTVEGRLLRRGRRAVAAEGALYAAGKLAATAVATCLPT